MMTSPTTFTC